MMAKNPKSPGVYIQELDAFGNSVVPVPTAIPVFVGYTAQTSFNGKSLLNKPIKITSLAEFFMVFGPSCPQVQFVLSTVDNNQKAADFVFHDIGYQIHPTTINYRMYGSIKFFYENGGGVCYIMSIGGYDYSKPTITDISDFTKAISLLEKELEPTMLLIPDLIEIKEPGATSLKDKYANAYSLQSVMINHCGEMGNRVAILDIPGGYSEPPTGPTSVDQFRNSVEPLSPKFRSYAAAYYPWLHTTVFPTSQISYLNIDKASYPVVVNMLNRDFTDPDGKINKEMSKIISAFTSDDPSALNKADMILKNLSKSYQLLINAITTNMNLMAPSAGMAGIYTLIDNNEGVWVAPANVGIQSTIEPAVPINHTEQGILNTPVDGKAICAIRAFTGRGNLVWGARTLDANSNDWRYINVRRTMIYIEQSVKYAAQAYVFAQNDAGTWANVKGMISNFLTGLWNQGGLVGSKAADAFSVSVGLGSTMTPTDILDGIMRVTVKVAISHPAEFIEITFQQEMQKA